MNETSVAMTSTSTGRGRFEALRLQIGLVVREITAGALAGGIAGAIAGGLGGRLAMRITALMATEAEQGILTEAEETVGQITLDGSLALIVFGGVLIGVLGGLIYAAVSRWVADFRGWRGLVFGIVLLITLGWGIIEGDNFDFATLGSVTVNLAMFSAIFVLFGVLVAPLYARIRRSLPKPSFSVGGVLSLPVYAVGMLFAAVVLAATASALGEDGREAPLYAILPGYLLVCTTVAGAVITRRTGQFERLSDLRHDPRALGMALVVMAVPLLAGLALDAQALTEMFGDAY